MNKNKYSNLIQLNAENLGVKTLDNEIIDFLNMEIEEKLKTVLSQARKFMRVSKRKTLKVDDLNQALKFFNFKGLFGYDSYANAEYESIDSLTGLWRPKQNIIDLEDYISKPIASCPMQSFPHFHWVSIEGKRPIIPENFIRDEIKPVISNLSNNKNENRELSSNNHYDNLGLNTDNYLSNAEQKEESFRKSKRINIPLIHNISKELQIFLENFEQRFRKEIKISKLNPYPIFTMTKELEISLNVIENEPGVVEIIPYIIEFLMKNLANKQYFDQPKVHMISLSYINGILKNPYFYIEPYLHQIVTLIISVILIEVNSTQIDLIINVKNFAIGILKKIFVKYEVKYPNFITQLINIFKQNIIPQKNNPHYLTCYGAIKSLNILGPAHVMELVIPKLEEILAIVNINYVIVNAKENKNEDYNSKDEENTNININTVNNYKDSNLMEIDQEPNIQGTAEKGNLTFTNTMGQNQLFASLLLSEPNASQNIYQNSFTNQEKQNDANKNTLNEKINSEAENNLKRKYSEQKVLKSFYVYYALKESAILALNYANLTEMRDSENLFSKITDIFGEDILQNLINSNDTANEDILNLSI